MKARAKGLVESLQSASDSGDLHPDIYKKHKRVIAAELRTRVVWFIKLRWFVPFGIAGGATLADAVGFTFNMIAVLLVALFVLLYNAVCYYIRPCNNTNPCSTDRLYTFTYSQVALDYLALFLLVHWAGGAASPIIFVFIFHIIFASILLPRRSAYGFAAVAIIGMWSMAFGEMTGLLDRRLVSFRGETIDLLDKPWYVASMLVFFSGAIGATVLSTTAIMRMLKQRIIENAQFYEQIEQLTKERWRFMRKVAHNLRAPLAAVISMMDLLKNEYLGKMEPKQVEYLHRIYRRTKHMTDMINELMTIARSRTDTALLSRHPMRVDAIADRVLKTFIVEAETKGLGFVFEVSPEIAEAEIDLELAEPVLENLVSNAIKYTSKGDVRVSFTKSGNDFVVIQIQDTGIGIPKEDQSQLFREFFRAHNARTVEEVGTGLGLALVKETLDKNGGKITFESKLGKGTTFMVYLPITPKRS